MQRITLIRHGETEGNSSIRYHGRRDVPLSALGMAQLEATAHALRARFGDCAGDLWVASPLQRSWRGAALVGRGRPVRICRGFGEVDFGRWEGLTAQEIEARDPELFARWRAGGSPAFSYPGGESRAAFQARVGEALDGLLASGAGTSVAVLHKGVIREIVRRLLGDDALDREAPALGEALVLSRGARFALIDRFGPDG